MPNLALQTPAALSAAALGLGTFGAKAVLATSQKAYALSERFTVWPNLAKILVLNSLYSLSPPTQAETTES